MDVLQNTITGKTKITDMASLKTTEGIAIRQAFLETIFTSRSTIRHTGGLPAILSASALSDKQQYATVPAGVLARNLFFTK
jgi:hypothetical protein